MKVSVIVPIYRVEKQLPRCVESLLCQTHKDLEILLVDDGSPDTCPQMCDDYAKKDSRIRVIHKQNSGVSDARNRALEQVSGDYLLFLDGDDSLEPETVEACLLAAENGKYDIVCFGYRLFLDRSGGAEFLQEDAKEPCDIRSGEELSKGYAKFASLGILDFVTDKLIRTSLISEHGIRFDSYFNMGGEDGVFVLDLLPYIRTVRVLGDCFYNYFRREGESMTVSFKEGKPDRYHARAKRVWDYLEAANTPDKAFVVNLYLTNLLWVYDSLFSPTCRLSLKEKLRFLRTAFKKEELYDGFGRDLAAAAKAGNPTGDFSKSSRKALVLITKKKFFALSLLYLLTYFKNRR